MLLTIIYLLRLTGMMAGNMWYKNGRIGSGALSLKGSLAQTLGLFAKKPNLET